MTETRTAPTLNAVVANYFAMLNETDPARRRAVTATVMTPDAAFLDPMFEARGYEELDALVAAIHERFPGYRFRQTSAVDTHHDRARWDWECIGPDGGAPAATGVDFALLASDGRLRSVTGFFAPPVD